jgi:hypothetical protein
MALTNRRLPWMGLCLGVIGWLASAGPAASQSVTLTTLDIGGYYGSTGQSHSRTVVSNQYGYFATYVHDRDEDGNYAQWRLVRSTDGGSTFTTVYSATHGTPAPVIETDRNGNIYLIHSDQATTGNAVVLRFSAADTYSTPVTLATLSEGGAQKFSAVIDEERGQLYYASVTSLEPAPYHTKMYFFTVPLNGGTPTRVRLTQPGTIADAQYPHLYLDEHGDLYAAWTTAEAGMYTYESIHIMRSRNGGVSWQNLKSEPVTLPVVADYSGPTEMVNATYERAYSPFLANMIVKQGKAHFFYRTGLFDPQWMHYVRYDVVTGVREDDVTPIWSGGNYSLNNLDGFCTTRRERLDSTLYCVSKTTDHRLAVLVSTDNGQSWQDYAATAPFPNPNCVGCLYAITGARQITDDGYLIGAFRYDKQDNTGEMPIKFLRVPVPTVTQTRLVAMVTTSGAHPNYPAIYANDNNPATPWVASLTATPANNNAWIQLDLGSVKEVRKIAWNSPVGSPYPAHGPSHYTVSVSDNGVRWTTVATRTYGAGVTGAAEPVYLNTRYIRLTTTMVNDGTGWSLSFYEFWAEGVDPPATTRLSTVGVYSGSNAAGYPVSNADDGNPTTWYVASSTLQPGNNDAWIELDLGSVKPITRVKWTGGGVGSPYPGHSPTNYTIQVANNVGGPWTILKSRVHDGAIVNGDEVVAVSARYIILLATKVHDYSSGYAMSFSEFWVEGVEPAVTTRIPAVAAYSGSAAASYPVSYANDQNPATQFIASSTTQMGNNDAWIELDLGSVQPIKRVKWIGASGTPFPAHSPASYTIQVSNDGVNWKIVKSRVNHPSGVVNGNEVLDVSARYVILRTTSVHDYYSGYALSFFEFWTEH